MWVQDVPHRLNSPIELANSGIELMSERMKELQRRWRAHARIPSPNTQRSDAVIGITASFTIDPLLPYLGAQLLEAGATSPDIQIANYNQILRVCRQPDAEFKTKDLDAIVVMFRIEDLAAPDEPHKVVEACHHLLNGIEQLREIYPGMIIVGLPPRPRPFIEGIAGFARSSELTRCWHATLSRLMALSHAVPNFYIVDSENLVAECGEAQAFDHRKELMFRQPFSEAFYVSAAGAIARIFRARCREPKKCLVLDCDNTLWGGVIGEDGIGGVQLSDDFPGIAFRHFQRQVLALRHSGIFIALSSKNNPEDVWDMFDNHGAMVLRRSDISADRVNWRPKSENLKAIAQELNIGLDALVFIDDNPFEIDEVRTNAPGVTCVQVPEDIADLPVVMRQASRMFDRLEITADDRARVDMVRHESSRRDLAQKLTGEDYLASLELVVDVSAPETADIARITQLINKTNQFNVTTRRYSAEEVTGFVKSADIDVLRATVRDRFGDYGLVAVAIVKHGAGSSEIDSFLMSCRVLSRGVETALMSEVIDLVRARGNQQVNGCFIPTRKNAMVADVFERLGFAPVPGVATEDGPTFWRREPTPLAKPTYLTSDGHNTTAAKQASRAP